eukprot:5115076-Lingulodinium_polyedra.AAC.1
MRPVAVVHADDPLGHVRAMLAPCLLVALGRHDARGSCAGGDRRSTGVTPVAAARADDPLETDARQA